MNFDIRIKKILILKPDAGHKKVPSYVVESSNTLLILWDYIFNPANKFFYQFSVC
jgi:hypothetical protein